MDDVLNKINQADDDQIMQIINAVIGRYGRLFPEWEIMFLSLPRGERRVQAIREMMEFLLRHET